MFNMQNLCLLTTMQSQVELLKGLLVYFYFGFENTQVQLKPGNLSSEGKRNTVLVFLILEF